MNNGMTSNTYQISLKHDVIITLVDFGKNTFFNKKLKKLKTPYIYRKYDIIYLIF